jgi:hydrogenase maturation protein HypF
MDMSKIRGLRIHITGVVQGVGFRPFIYSLAQQSGLKGWVRNTSSGVNIQVDGTDAHLQSFAKAIKEQAPPLARIDSMQVEACPPEGFADFRILPSRAAPGEFQPISPDMSVCEECLREMQDPQDRRYRYPFINCTNCGPRFTIITDIPYDRPNTTMAPFPMCDKCAAEYENPLDRRFHAQPVACDTCGPHVWLELDGKQVARHEGAIQTARNLLRQGKVLALKGLGGFHLACDATNAQAVARLRERKLRVDKPFAIMMPDLEEVRRHCEIDAAEEELLQSPERPIVILQRSSRSSVASGVAPGQRTLGVMLPYTPLHSLILEREEGFPPALVMTSGNLSEEPIATDNQEARTRLQALADAFLMHNRRIRTRCDDSVVRVFEELPYPLRRSRGYAPFPVHVPWKMPPLLAVGAELKNAFCLTRDHYAFLSHHIGDMENYETLRAFEDGVEHLERLFRITPQALAYDLHPDYMATRYALERAARQGLPAFGVQHHHAHIASCMAEHHIPARHPVLGVAFDGTGFGEDSTIWGGEFLLADYCEYERLAHLSPIRLAGGDAAVRHPWRLALAWLHRLGEADAEDLPPLQKTDPQTRLVVIRQIEAGLNAPLTSSMGRLFDAVSALAGMRMTANYEAQAAIELEAAADPQEERRYEFAIDGDQIDALPVIAAVVKELRSGVSQAKIAARFHNGVAAMVVALCIKLGKEHDCHEVALSGGVWQNMLLLEKSVRGLREAGFDVLFHRQVPANDGGVALGQAVVALQRLESQQALSARPEGARKDGS